MVENFLSAVGAWCGEERIPVLEVVAMTDVPVEKSAKEKLEKMMERVRSMPRGGDLASLLTRELGELAELAEREALREREKAEDDRRKAGFSPSGKPSQ
jgi:hypothetical protein